MLDFLVGLIGGWAFLRMDRLSPQAVRRLAGVFAAICATAAAAFVVVLILVLK